jgi:hypothetical protein
VKAVFTEAETWRARRIAATEAARAFHAAGELSAIESGVVAGWQWLVSADACPMCLMVAAEARTAKLHQAFAVVGDHPDYSQVRFPPLHPHCQCSVVPILLPEYGGPPAVAWGPTLVNPKPGKVYVPPEGVTVPIPEPAKPWPRVLPGLDLSDDAPAGPAIPDAPDTPSAPANILKWEAKIAEWRAQAAAGKVDKLWIKEAVAYAGKNLTTAEAILLAERLNLGSHQTKKAALAAIRGYIEAVLPPSLAEAPDPDAVDLQKVLDAFAALSALHADAEAGKTTAEALESALKALVAGLNLGELKALAGQYGVNASGKTKVGVLGPIRAKLLAALKAANQEASVSLSQQLSLDDLA